MSLQRILNHGVHVGHLVQTTHRGKVQTIAHGQTQRIGCHRRNHAFLVQPLTEIYSTITQHGSKGCHLLCIVRLNGGKLHCHAPGTALGKGITIQLRIHTHHAGHLADIIHHAEPIHHVIRDADPLQAICLGHHIVRGKCQHAVLHFTLKAFHYRKHHNKHHHAQSYAAQTDKGDNGKHATERVEVSHRQHQAQITSQQFHADAAVSHIPQAHASLNPAMPRLCHIFDTLSSCAVYQT